MLESDCLIISVPLLKYTTPLIVNVSLSAVGIIKCDTLLTIVITFPTGGVKTVKVKDV